MPSPANLQMRIYRRVQLASGEDQLVPYVLTLSPERELLSDLIDEAHVTRGAGVVSSGETMSVDPRNGGVRPSFKDRRKFNILFAYWATKESDAHAFENTEVIREQFFAEKETLELGFEERGEKCPDCVLGALLQKYRDEVLAPLFP